MPRSPLPVSIIQLNPGYFSVEAQQSVRSDAMILGADLTVNCPDTPPLLIGQSFQCSATNEKQEFFQVAREPAARQRLDRVARRQLGHLLDVELAFEVRPTDRSTPDCDIPLLGS